MCIVGRDVISINPSEINMNRRMVKTLEGSNVKNIWEVYSTDTHNGVEEAAIC